MHMNSAYQVLCDRIGTDDPEEIGQLERLDRHHRLTRSNEPPRQRVDVLELGVRDRKKTTRAVGHDIGEADAGCGVTRTLNLLRHGPLRSGCCAGSTIFTVACIR